MRSARRQISGLAMGTALALIGVLSGMFGAPRPAAAHPLGNFSVNRYTRLEPGRDQIRLLTILDMAEIPTLQERPQIDSNNDSVLSEAERAAYLSALLDELQGQLALSVDGGRLSLTRGASSLELRPGQGGLETMRVEAELLARLPAGAGPWSAQFADRSFAERLGWREVVVQPASGVQLLASSAPASDISAELRDYPVDMLNNAPTTTTAEFRFASGVAAAPRIAAPVAATRAGDPLGGLLDQPIEGLGALLAALSLAIGLGATHALTPGHGKTIVAAYLVGSRGTVGHALFLGLTTTITHTAGVFAFGLITLFVSNYVLPEQLYPWLSVLSGALICVLGVAMLRQRLAGLRHGAVADHDHAGLEAGGVHSHGFGAHSHAPASQPVSWRGLLALGVSGGLLPCPSALVLLLGSVALGRVGLGLALVLAFSLGLAGVLTLIGILMVRARGLFARLPIRGAGSLLPIAGAGIVALAGLGITLQALNGLLQII